MNGRFFAVLVAAVLVGGCAALDVGGSCPDGDCDAIGGGIDVTPTFVPDEDHDGDDYTGDEGDCDDANAAVHPYATEACNGIDDDCDGQIDEGITTTWYLDADSDGHGNGALSIVTCSVVSGYVLSADDCDDADATIHPGATEACDSEDNDCDGTVDEGCNTAEKSCADLGLVFTPPSSWSNEVIVTCTPDLYGRGFWINAGIESTNSWSFPNGYEFGVRCAGQLGTWRDVSGVFTMSSVAWECEDTADPEGCTASRTAQTDGGCDGFYDPS